jgi:two-component system, LuxR family, response regulator FixJ
VDRVGVGVALHMTRELCVVVVDGDARSRNGIRVLLEANHYSVRVFSSGTAFLESDLPGIFCLVADADLPDIGGMELHREIRKRGLHVPVIITTSNGAIAPAVQAIKAGAADFLQKPVPEAALLSSLETIFKNRQAAQIPFATREPVAALLSRLTRREFEIFYKIAKGASNKVTALELGLSPRTVELHRARIMRKLNANNLADLVRISLADKQAFDGMHIFHRAAAPRDPIQQPADNRLEA